MALNLNPIIILKDNYKEEIDDEIGRNHIYLELYENNSFKNFFIMTKNFIIKIQSVVHKTRGDTHNDEYFTSICKFFMELLNLDENECDE